MSALAMPFDSPKSYSRGHASSWTQLPTLTITTSESDSSSDPSSVYEPSEPDACSGSSAGHGDSQTDSLTPGPRGHRLAWTVPSRIVQTPSIPAFPQISISLSTLSFTRSRLFPSPSSSLLSSSPSTPTTLSSSSSTSDRREKTGDKPTPSSHFLRAPSSHCTVNFTNDWSNNDPSLTKNKSRKRANSFSSTSTNSATSRRSTFASSTAAFFTAMSRPSWDPCPLIVPAVSTTSTSASISPSTTTAPKSSISNLNPISIEDARLLDPTYLSSVPIPTQNSSYGLCAGGSHSIGMGGVARYSHAIPYIDPQGTLHDPDYRPFPLIRQTKRSMMPSPFAIRRPYWEDSEDGFHEEDDCGFGGPGGGEDGYDTDGSTPSTPTSITPFICYFLETHPLKRTTALRNNVKDSPALSSSSSTRIFGSSYDSVDSRNNRKGKRGKGPGSQLKLGTAYMYASITTGLGGGTKGSSSQGGGYGAYTPTTPTVTGSPVAQYTSMLSSSPPLMEGGSVMQHGKEKEKKGWGGLLWKASGRKEAGGD